MQQLNCRQDGGAGASVPGYKLRQWVCWPGERLHFDENTTERKFTPCIPSGASSWEGGGHMEGKGLSSKGKLVKIEILTLWINLHKINIATHWSSRYPKGVRDSFYHLSVTLKTRPRQERAVHALLLWFILGHTISSDDREGGGLGSHKRANIQSRWDNKKENERQLRMAGCPWGGCAVIMLERAAELRCGAIRDQRIDWGRVQAQQPVREVFSAQRKGATNLHVSTLTRMWLQH